MATYAYIDNSNLYIEGTRVSAVKKGLVHSFAEAMERGIVDHAWQMDYGKLYEFICGEDAVARLWGSPPPGDSFWNMLHRKGFNPTVYDKNVVGKEKKVDVAIGARMTKDAYTVIDKEKDEILLVAGDSDYVPVLEDLKSEGYRVEVAFWDHSTAREVKALADKFVSLTQYHDHFSR
jgi:hypothetical protein